MKYVLFFIGFTLAPSTLIYVMDYDAQTDISFSDLLKTKRDSFYRRSGQQPTHSPLPRQEQKELSKPQAAPTLTGFQASQQKSNQSFSPPASPLSPTKKQFCYWPTSLLKTFRSNYKTILIGALVLIPCSFAYHYLRTNVLKSR